MLGQGGIAALWGSNSVALAQQRDRWQMKPEMAGAGSLVGFGVHEIDLLAWLLGEEVVEVAAMTDGPSDQYPVEFLAAGTLRFASGALAQFASSRRLPNGRHGVSVYGSDGRLDGEDTLSMTPSGELRIASGAETRTVRVPLRDAYQAEVEAFSRAVEHGEPFEASGEDGARVVAVLAALLESAATGRFVQPAKSAVEVSR
jgi:1,5-anhydro-D-fructose reductase (1,5-anhydro-D-mannitol-forming)